MCHDMEGMYYMGHLLQYMGSHLAGRYYMGEHGRPMYYRSWIPLYYMGMAPM